MIKKKKSEAEKESPKKRSTKKTSRSKTVAETSDKRKASKELKRLKEALEKSKAEVSDLNEKYLRSVAELDNLRKRTEREAQQVIRTANKQLLLDLLPAVDDLNRSLKTSADTKPEDLRIGINMISKKLSGILKAAGVEAMDSAGKPFDVDQHDALMQMEREGVEAGIVIEVHEEGYFLNGDVLRHAKVVVSK